jgi:uncharacterized membrane protein
MGWGLGGAIGAYVGSLLFLAGAYLFAYTMDGILHDYNKYNESRRTIKLKLFNWLFGRSKKNIIGEIFIVTFVHELLTIILFLVTTMLFVISILLENALIMHACMAVAFLYMCYVLIRVSRIQKKYK